MLTVDHYELIRRKHLVDGMSQRDVARELGHSRNTVAKAVANPIPPGYRMAAPRGRPVIDPVRPIIDAWIEEDRTRPRKQRLTAQRIYERLRDEHGFAGNVTTVRRYVRVAERRMKDVYVPLAFEPGVIIRCLVRLHDQFEVAISEHLDHHLPRHPPLGPRRCPILP